MYPLERDEVGPAKTATPPRWTRTHLGIVVYLYLMVAGFVGWASGHGSPGDLADRNRPLIALAAITGPFDGAIARHGQSCCLAFSRQVALGLCGPALGLAIAVQFLPRTWLGGATDAVRYTGWTLGWLIWFLGVPISFLHALN